jgi:tetratricopeptide (TPR) repeat protein
MRAFKKAATVPGAMTAAASAGSEPGLGPLTEVGGLRRTAEEFRRISPDLPTGPANAGAVAPRRAIAAERQCERGVALAAAGRLGAAIAAFTRAARLDPRNAAVHHRLGRALLDSGRAAEAVESLRLATALRDDAAACCDLALSLRRQRLDAEAIAAYRRAVALAPCLVEALIGLAEFLELGGDFEEAARLYRRAGDLAPDTVSGRLHLAQAAMTEGDFGAAETGLRGAAVLDPENDLVHKLLGDVLVRQGRFDEAVATFDHVLALNPRQVSAYFTMAEAGKCTEADRPRLAHVLAALGNAALDDEDRLLLHFAAGKMLDDLGEYQTAMAHFDAANAVRDRSAKFDAAAFAADVDRLVQRFTPDFYAANRAFGEVDETPLLIVGMPRSGTTLVEQILSRHRQIGGGGELPFWIRRATAHGTLEATYLRPDSGRALAREYLSVLRGIAPSAARVTDKLPFNVLCVGLIHLLLPNARIIQCRRHPVDTCLSIYFTHFQQTISFSSDKRALAAAYRQYARLMDHWRSVLPAARCLDVDYEELVSDREAVTRGLIAFAGLEWSDDCLTPERNPRAVATASLWQGRQPVYTSSVARWRHYEPWLGELRQLLDRAEDDRV